MQARIRRQIHVPRYPLFSKSVLIDSLIRLDPRKLVRNPVMLIVELTFFVVAAMAIYPAGFSPLANVTMQIFYVEVALILLITVWFSTLSDSLAETQAKNTANSLRSLEMEVLSKKITPDAEERRIVQTPSKDLRKSDLILI